MVDVSARVAANEKVKRDAEIVRDRARGLTWETIALRYGLSTRQCRAVFSEWAREQPSPFKANRLDLLHETLASYDLAVEEFALLADDATQETVRLGALRTKLAAMDARLQLMISLAMLPIDPRKVLEEADYRAQVIAIAEILNDPVVPTYVRERIYAMFDELDAAESARDR